MFVLVINCGSSSIKYKLYDMKAKTELAGGLIERVGEANAHTVHNCGAQTFERNHPVENYERGIEQILTLLSECGDPPPVRDPQRIDGVGHRVVHGGEAFAESVLATGEVLAAIEDCIPLAPLHNPANLAGIRAATKALPGKPQAAVFDTAFFQTMPPSAYLYALPYEWYEKHRVRRYGFHGTSHRYVTEQAARLLGNERPNLITLHLGNGASMTCIREGRAVDQTLGLTPLEGLVMGTRCGDIDPAIVFYMVQQGMTLDEVRQHLEKKSGLLGVSGVSRDLRDVESVAAEGNERARLALEVFAHRVRKYIGAYLVELGHCEALVFTGGIGENAADMRARILDGLTPLGIALDSVGNSRRSRDPFRVTAIDSPIGAWVIPTDEELMIARDTARLIT